MSAWKVLVVDDEPPIRAELHYLLAQDGRVGEVLEAGGVTRAVEQIMAGGVDVVFLDISMPGSNGMRLAEFLKNLQTPPVLVFVTAYSEHAVQAFDLDAVDYVLKPVESSRLERALAKVENAIKQRDQRGTGRDLRISAERDGNKVFILARDISYVEARGDYADIHTQGASYLAKSSMASLEERLADEGFMRVHKSFIVNIGKVHGVRALGQGLMELTLAHEERTIPVSRRRTAQLKETLGIA